jgi:hypothetical protein
VNKQKWRWIDAVTWHCQPTEDAAFRCWIECHPGKSKVDYPRSESIKAFNASLTGRVFNAIASFNYRWRCLLLHPWQSLRLLGWYWDYYYRCYQVQRKARITTIEPPKNGEWWNPALLPQRENLEGSGAGVLAENLEVAQ